MTTTKIACLIPSTSNGRDWKKLTETYLYKHTIKSYFHTYNKDYLTRFYIGIDRNDPIYDNEENKNKIEQLEDKVEELENKIANIYDVLEIQEDDSDDSMDEDSNEDSEEE